MDTRERNGTDLPTTLVTALKRLLPVTHGNFTLGLAGGLNGSISTEQTFENPDTGEVRTARGVWILLEAVTFDASGAVVDISQQEVHIAHDPDVNPARLVAFLEGWRAALPTLIERYHDSASPLQPFELLDASLCVPTANTPDEFKSALMDPDGPMREWAREVQQIRTGSTASAVR